MGHCWLTILWNEASTCKFKLDSNIHSSHLPLWSLSSKVSHEIALQDLCARCKDAWITGRMDRQLGGWMIKEKFGCSWGMPLKILSVKTKPVLFIYLFIYCHFNALFVFLQLLIEFILAKYYMNIHDVRGCPNYFIHCVKSELIMNYINNNSFNVGRHENDLKY